jgi:hypothetical protein
MRTCLPNKLSWIVVGTILAIHLCAAEPPGGTTDDSARVGIKEELLRVQNELRKTDLEFVKADDARAQFYWKLCFDGFLVFAGAGLLLWMFPQIHEFSLPWGGGSLSAKRIQKEPIPTPTTPPPEPENVLKAAEVLKRELPAEAGSRDLIDKLDEAGAYQTAGIQKDSIYIAHRARRIPRSEYHRLHIYLDADEPELLERVEKVVYHLHPTFRRQRVEVVNRSKSFCLDTTVWGEFMLFADVHLKGAAHPVELKRYLNF